MMERHGVQGVLFGHHIGDVFENIISNMFKFGDLFDLEGMKKVSEIEGVFCLRPYLHLSKDLIYDFSHTFGVPYFKDTTPSWSNRGKMRNSLLPLLSDMFFIFEY